MEDAVRPPGQRCGCLYGPVRPECKTAFHGNGSIRVRKSKKEYGMSQIGISERQKQALPKVQYFEPVTFQTYYHRSVSYKRPDMQEGTDRDVPPIWPSRRFPNEKMEIPAGPSFYKVWIQIRLLCNWRYRRQCWRPSAGNFCKRARRYYTSPGESTHKLGQNRSIYTTLPSLSECKACIARQLQAGQRYPSQKSKEQGENFCYGSNKRLLENQ